MKTVRHDGRVTYENVRVEAGATYIAHVENLYLQIPSLDQLSIAEGSGAEDLPQLLLPIFKFDQAAVSQFLASVEGLKSAQITRIVNRWVKEGRIDPKQKHKPLWQVLHDHGIYDRKLCTWNSQVE